MVNRTAALLVLIAAPASAQTFAYSPGAQRYRIEISVQNVKDQNGGRAPAQFDYSSTQFVTVHLTRQSSDTLAISVTIDSVTTESTMNAEPPDLTWEKGATLNGTISPTGHVYAFAAPNSADGNMRGLYDGFKYFLPALPSSIAAGTSWADTSKQRTGQRGPFDSVTTRRIITSRVTGDTTYAGQRAWRIERSGSMSVSGQGSEGGKVLRLAGDGTIRGVHFVSVGGVYLGSRLTQVMRSVESFQDTGDGPASTATIKSDIQPLPPVRTADVTGVR